RIRITGTGDFVRPRNADDARSSGTHRRQVQMSTTTLVASALTPAFTPQPSRPPDEVLAWLRGRLDWEDRLHQLHEDRAGSATPEPLRSPSCPRTSTRSSDARSKATA